MAILDTLNLNGFDLGSIDTSLLNDFFQGDIATLHPVALLAGGLLALATVSALGLSVIRLKRRMKALEARWDDSQDRLQTIEILLADTTSEASLLRQRVEQRVIRQENTVSSSAKTSLRQAIALSKHGATTRQLIDTCELSQGEAHLIQTLYGQPAGTPAAEELH
jgi:hypothetical protein